MEAAGDLKFSFRAIRDRIEAKDVDKHAAFCVLKKREPGSVVYFLEKRRDDDSFAAKFALYGGKRKEGDLSYEAIIARELREELKIPVRDNDFRDLSFHVASRQNGKLMAAEVFVLDDHHLMHHFKSAKFLSHIRSLKNDKVGEPVKIRRFGTRWMFNSWHKLTPIAAFALLQDCENDIRSH